LTVDFDAWKDRMRVEKDIRSVSSGIDGLLERVRAKKGVKNAWYSFKFGLCKKVMGIVSWIFIEGHMKRMRPSFRLSLCRNMVKVVLWILGDR
jgi:hypothetical protein